MAEHDDALPELDLDLGVLADGVRPSAAQWDAITTTAAHRRRRRTWALSAAAALVLIATTAAVLLTRSEHEGIDLATGGPGEELFVIPPADATDVHFDDRGHTYGINYRTGGEKWVLQTSNDEVLPGSTPGQLLEAMTTYGLAHERIDPFGTVFIGCTGEFSNATMSATDATGAPNTTIQLDAGLRMAAWGVGGQLLSLHSTAGGVCSSTAPEEVAAAVGELRLVDRDAFEAWRLGTDGGPPPTDVREEPSIEVPSTTTALPEEPPAEADDARAQIGDLIHDYTEPADDRTYPKLEDGVARAAEYREILELMRRRAGTDLVAEPQPTIATLTSITFVSPTEAAVVWDNEVTLPGTTGAHFSQQGRALLQDGHWVMSYDTIQNILARSCVPPGGHDPSCRSGG